MAKIGAEIEVKIGEDGLIVLREPTNREWNQFESERYPVGRNMKMRNNATAARAVLFDRLVLRIENLEDEQGPLGMETLARIPERMKSDIVFKSFEAAEQIEVKN